ncbi:MAG: glycoside hydrolase family 16 protein [Bacteroidota bacterium]
MMEPSKDWKLVWSDEFDYTGLPDAKRWSYDKGDGCPNVCGWGNNELQYYTWDRLDNARVEEGRLIIEAHKEPYKQKAYTSARLVSRQKGDWTYGRFEVRAKLPSGRGTWPAIWMLPTDWKYGGWPKSGEIDIMEHVGYARDTVYGTVHTGAFNHLNGTHKGDNIHKPDAEHAFHDYAIEWDAERIRFSVDGEEYFVFENNGDQPAAWPFDQRFHFVLNIAVGGNWGGKHGVDDRIWPQRMEIDYVRVYQRI